MWLGRDAIRLDRLLGFVCENAHPEDDLVITSSLGPILTLEAGEVSIKKPSFWRRREAALILFRSEKKRGGAFKARDLIDMIQKFAQSSTEGEVVAKIEMNGKLHQLQGDIKLEPVGDDGEDGEFFLSASSIITQVFEEPGIMGVSGKPSIEFSKPFDVAVVASDPISRINRLREGAEEGELVDIADVDPDADASLDTWTDSWDEEWPEVPAGPFEDDEIEDEPEDEAVDDVSEEAEVEDEVEIEAEAEVDEDADDEEESEEPEDEDEDAEKEADEDNSEAEGEDEGVEEDESDEDAETEDEDDAEEAVDTSDDEDEDEDESEDEPEDVDESDSEDEPEDEDDDLPRGKHAAK